VGAVGGFGLGLGGLELFAVFLAGLDEEFPKCQGKYIRSSNIISAPNHSINTLRLKLKAMSQFLPTRPPPLTPPGFGQLRRESFSSPWRKVFADNSLQGLDGVVGYREYSYLFIIQL
jgi:hypothetical protein